MFCFCCYAENGMVFRWQANSGFLTDASSQGFPKAFGDRFSTSEIPGDPKWCTLQWKTANAYFFYDEGKNKPLYRFVFKKKKLFVFN